MPIVVDAVTGVIAQAAGPVAAVSIAALTVTAGALVFTRRWLASQLESAKHRAKLDGNAQKFGFDLGRSYDDEERARAFLEQADEEFDFEESMLADRESRLQDYRGEVHSAEWVASWNDFYLELDIDQGMSEHDARENALTHERRISSALDYVRDGHSAVEAVHLVSESEFEILEVEGDNYFSRHEAIVSAEDQYYYGRAQE